MPGSNGSKRHWFPGREYLKEFLEYCRRANLPGKQELIEKLEQTLSGDIVPEVLPEPPEQTQSANQGNEDTQLQGGQVTREE